MTDVEESIHCYFVGGQSAVRRIRCSMNITSVAFELKEKKKRNNKHNIMHRKLAI